MTIKAIETWYAGCRFRSRLEARWAVFFDHLGIVWEYEPQGYELPSGRYLPDFWLPGLELWVEVKGDEKRIKPRILREAATELPGNGLMVLGSVPPPPPDGHVMSHVFLHRDKKLPLRVIWGVVELATKGDKAWPTQVDIAAIDQVRGKPAYTSYLAIRDPYRCPFVGAAYTAARSARFEHGQSGA